MDFTVANMETDCLPRRLYAFATKFPGSYQDLTDPCLEQHGMLYKSSGVPILPTSTQFAVKSGQSDHPSGMLELLLLL